jgi:hypothetical protein
MNDLIPLNMNLVPTNQIKSEFNLILFKTGDYYYILEDTSDLSVLKPYIRYFAGEFFNKLKETTIRANDMIIFINTLPDIMKPKYEDISSKSIDNRYIQRLKSAIKTQIENIKKLERKQDNLSSISPHDTTTSIKKQQLILNRLTERISYKYNFVKRKLDLIESLKKDNVILVTCKMSLISFLEQKDEYHKEEYIEFFKSLTQKNGESFEKYIDSWSKKLLDEFYPKGENNDTRTNNERNN